MTRRAPGAAGSSCAKQETTRTREQPWDNTGINGSGYIMSYAHKSAVSCSLCPMLVKSDVN